MRVLLASDFYPPTVGGMERHVSRIAAELTTRGHHVEVVTSATSKAPNGSTDDGVVVHRLRGSLSKVPGAYQDSERPFPVPAADPGLVAGLHSVVERFQPDVVHTHGWMTFPAAKVSASKRHALVTTVHDSGLLCSKRALHYLDREPCSGPSVLGCVRCASSHYGVVKGLGLAATLRASRHLLDRVDMFLPVAGVLGDMLAGTPGLGDIPRTTIPNFFDLDRIPSPDTPRPASVPEHGPYVLFVGTLGKFKGVHALVDVWRRFAPPAQLVLMGMPTYDTPTDLPANVTMVTDVAHAEVMAAFQHCAFAVLPSQFPEPSPTVVLEPMACGRPVIASDIGGIPDLIDDGVTGLLVPHDDLQALAVAIHRLLDDHELREKLGANAKVRSRLFAQQAIVDRIEVAYRQTLQGRPSRVGIQVQT